MSHYSTRCVTSRVVLASELRKLREKKKQNNAPIRTKLETFNKQVDENVIVTISGGRRNVRGRARECF